MQRMYILDFLKTLCVLTLGIASIFSLIGLIDKADEFMPHKPSAKLLFQYVLYMYPKYIQYMLPMAILLSSLFIFSQALRRREIVVIKAAGGKLKTLLRPFVVLGVLLTLFGFVLGEVVVPHTSKKLRSLANQIMKKETKVSFREGTLYLRGKDGSVVRIGLYLPDKDTYQSVSIFSFDAEKLHQRIDAETATWQGDHWLLRNVQTVTIASGERLVSQQMLYTGIDSPKIFQKEVWKVEEMSLIELYAYKMRLQEAGFRNIKLTVDISSRLAYPLINLFMLLLGISLSVGGDQDLLQRLYQMRMLQNAQSHAGIMSAGIGLMISLFYWFGYSFCLSLGYAGSLPPTLTPWIVPALFSGISAYLFINIPE